MFDAEWKKFNEKMVVRQEILEDKQLSTKEANQAEFERHKKQASMVKERDFQAVLQRINERQAAVNQRVAQTEKERIENIKVQKEEETIKREKREKKKQREMRKLLLKKEAVVSKMLKN